MHTQHSIKTDSTGNVDTQYYIDRAYQMRREYNAELFASTKRFVKSLFRMELPKLHIGHHAHH